MTIIIRNDYANKTVISHDVNIIDVFCMWEASERACYDYELINYDESYRVVAWVSEKDERSALKDAFYRDRKAFFRYLPSAYNDEEKFLKCTNVPSFGLTEEEIEEVRTRLRSADLGEELEAMPVEE